MKAMLNAVMVSLAIVFSLALVEAGLRIHDAAPFPVEKTSVRLNGKEYKLVNTATSLSGKESRTVFIGDSFVEGNKCGNDHNLPGRYAELVGGDTQVDNLGVGGAGPFDYLDVIQNYVEEVGRPNRMFVIYYFNDIELFPSACRYRTGMSGSRLFTQSDMEKLSEFCSQESEDLERTRLRFGGNLDNTFRWSRTYVLLREIAARVALRLWPETGIGRAHFIDLWEGSGSLEYKTVVYSIGEITRIADDFGIDLVVGFYPNVESLTADSRLVGPYEDIVSFVRQEYNTEAFNGYPVFLSNPKVRPNMSSSLLDTHPNCEAHGIMANYLVRSF